MMGHWNDSWFCGPGMFGGGPWGWMFSLGFWLLLILAAVALFRYFAAGRTTVGAASSSALDILKRRYATGEIDREEFELRKRDLT